MTYIHTQNASLRAEVSLLRTRLRDSYEENYELRELLSATEKRLDRVQSKAFAAVYPSNRSSDEDRVKEEVKEEVAAQNGESAEGSGGSPKAVSHMSSQD